MTDAADPFANLPAVPGMLLGNAAAPGSVSPAAFIPQRGMGISGVAPDTTPPADDAAAPAVPLMAAAAPQPAPVADARDAEMLPAGPFQAPEFRRPAEVPKSQVVLNFARYRDTFKTDKP